ncbi:MAG TPA: A/G-specific adenine glycosylase [Roseiflexaceae bacterium]|nr:A/G-specific adenine glycosylase [Roseiflexaceae bacterium]
MIQAKLLEWFAQHGRDLPWRHTRDPYHIMVSEIMLQQTQVHRVVPKYHAFLELFPSLEALADAQTAEVIRAWTGLGYNRRAVNMQRAARAVLQEHGGQFPRDLAALLKLPGIGPYTAGAIACFAFEQDVAFMDTNIRRVVQRLFGGPEAAALAGEASLLALAQAAVPPGQGWAWNQAIMELGALICMSATPACWRCPIQVHCRDYAARRAADEQLFSGAALPEPLRRVAERREAPFAGSNRFYRGRAIEALRGLAPGEALPLPALGQAIKQDFDEDDMPWLRTLAEGLARDGLLMLENEQARLP